MQSSMVIIENTENTIFLKFGPRNQNCWFKLKSFVWTNSNIQNSVVVFTFLILGWECPFWANLGKYGPKNQNRQFKLKFGT